MSERPSKKTLLLVGGGHAHVEVLRQLAAAPMPEVDVALFDPSPSVWYTGMVPGVIAGHYEPAQAKINLWALCQKARVRFIEAAVTEVLPEVQRIRTAIGEQHFFDFLSLDVGGATLRPPANPGSYVIPVKPIDQLLNAINEREAIKSSSTNVRVIGGGATAIETAFALAYRWRNAPEKKIGIVSAAQILSEFAPSARKAALAAAAKLRVTVLENTPVELIEPTRLQIANGELIESQITLLASGYAPARLMAKMTVEMADDGSISINSGLQSRSHRNIFAAGDCASNPKNLIAKSGVFAVRQGPVLAANLFASLKGEPIGSYHHDPKALALITLGDKRAIAARNGRAFTAAWAWSWKDHIDQRWVKKYSLSD
jgi:selenide, water dikinase